MGSPPLADNLESFWPHRHQSGGWWVTPGAAELSDAPLLDFMPFQGGVLHLKLSRCSWCPVQQSFPSSYFPPYLSPASLPALQCHSSAAPEQPGTGQCQGDKPEPGTEHTVRAPREGSRGQLAVGLGREKVTKVYPGRSQCGRWGAGVLWRGTQHRPIAAVQCRCFAFLALWVMPAWFCSILWQIKVPKGWHLPVCAPPCLAVRQCSVPVPHMSSCVFVRGWQWWWQASLALAAPSVTLLYTLQLLEHFAWGPEERSLLGAISFSGAEELELELLRVLGAGSGGYSGYRCGIDADVFILNYCSHA